MLTYLALGVGLVSLWLAWRSHRKNAELRERIAQVNSRVYHLRREMEEAQQKAEQEQAKLRFALLKLQGDLRVTGDMTIGDIYALHPQSAQVLAGFHIGGCASCAVDERLSLAEAVALSGRELEPVLVALNTLVAQNNGNQPLPADRLKTPNVQLQF
ncbi:MAG: hypothetical protein D6784_17350 [Chloroflexi bacterium]|nr:MAG: hypothetical protein D6784_17350 [Chloroflexota bacterium]